MALSHAPQYPLISGKAAGAVVHFLVSNEAARGLSSRLQQLRTERPELGWARGSRGLRPLPHPPYLPLPPTRGLVLLTPHPGEAPPPAHLYA